jgi:lactate dehydrogenase-like 2-hydroxyacid dehydrogenase
VAKIDILSAGSLPERPQASLTEAFAVHPIAIGAPLESIKVKPEAIRGIARGMHFPIDRAFIERLPNLEMIANFGVGYDGIDLKTSAERGVVVTNTPDVLTEEVADTAIGLLLMTVRELSSAERHVREGKWPSGGYRLTRGTMRDRTVGMIGLGRIGLAVARRLDAMQVPVVYHTRTKRPDVPYRYYADLTAMASDVDTLIAILPGTPQTQNLINASLLKALGPRGVLINIGRGNVVDEAALAAALRDGTIFAAGLDVFAKEPNVPAELLALPNIVLLPHVGSASIHTRDAMGQLVVDNLKSWFDKGKPLTPVPETPVPQKKK